MIRSSALWDIGETFPTLTWNLHLSFLLILILGLVNQQADTKTNTNTDANTNEKSDANGAVNEPAPSAPEDGRTKSAESTEVDKNPVSETIASDTGENLENISKSAGKNFFFQKQLQ